MKNKLQEREFKIKELSAKLNDVDKLKSKNRELFMYKDRQGDYNSISEMVQVRGKELETTQKQMELYSKEIDNLKSANIFLNENNKSLEEEKKKNLEDIEVVTKELNSLKNDYLEEATKESVSFSKFKFLQLFLLIFFPLPFINFSHIFIDFFTLD